MDTAIPAGSTGFSVRGFDTGAGIDEYVRDALNPFRGSSVPWAGVEGTVSVPSGHRVVSIACYSASGGTVGVGPASIPLPAGSSFSTGWEGFVGPLDVVFAGTDFYYVVTNG